MPGGMPLRTEGTLLEPRKPRVAMPFLQTVTDRLAQKLQLEPKTLKLEVEGCHLVLKIRCRNNTDFQIIERLAAAGRAIAALTAASEVWIYPPNGAAPGKVSVATLCQLRDDNDLEYASVNPVVVVVAKLLSGHWVQAFAQDIPKVIDRLKWAALTILKKPGGSQNPQAASSRLFR